MSDQRDIELRIMEEESDTYAACLRALLSWVIEPNDAVLDDMEHAEDHLHLTNAACRRLASMQKEGLLVRGETLIQTITQLHDKVFELRGAIECAESVEAMKET